MARYYFHIRSGDTIDPDEQGLDLPDFEAAKEEALATAREVLVEAIKAAKEDIPDSFVIADAHGRELATVPLREVIPKKLLG